MKKTLAVVLAVLMLVSIPVVYAAVEGVVAWCDICGHETTWEDVEMMYITYEDESNHLVSFYIHPTCLECGTMLEGVFETDSLEGHSVDENNWCDGCRSYIP